MTRLPWVLIAGTGNMFGLPDVVTWLAAAAGRAIASKGYGLVSGGWHGVDFIAASAFSDALLSTSPRTPLSDVMLQVVPKGVQPIFQGGHIVEVEPGPAEWIEALRYCDVVILIGGVGGTYRTYSHAIQERRSVFPLAAGGGDAETAFVEIRERWHTASIWGVSRSSFSQILGRPVSTPKAAHELIEDLMVLISDNLAFQSSDYIRDKLFVSYARTDREWLNAIKNKIRTLPLQSITIWDDSDIAPSSDFSREIQKAMSASRIALLLVSPAFLQSSFIRETELPYILRAHQNKFIHVFWIHLERCAYETTELAAIQASYDPRIPVAELTPSQQQAALAEISLKISQAVTELA